ncbi:MAG: hypothetical protein ACO3XJ_04480 [Candidatus Nanopelagicales bacterium]
MKKLLTSLLVAGFIATGVGTVPATASDRVLPTPSEAIATFDQAVGAYEDALAAYVNNGSVKGTFKSVRIAYKAVLKSHKRATVAISVAFKQGVKAAKVARKTAVESATTVDEKKAARATYNQSVSTLIDARDAQLADLGSLPDLPAKKVKS